MDDTELTGQEDINLLHTIINILPLTTAHKEGTLLFNELQCILLLLGSGEIPSKAALFVVTGAAITTGYIRRQLRSCTGVE